MKIKVYKDSELCRTWECDDYEEINECGCDNLYIEQDGIRRKACSIGDFGYGFWSYEVER